MYDSMFENLEVKYTYVINKTSVKAPSPVIFITHDRFILKICKKYIHTFLNET